MKKIIVLSFICTAGIIACSKKTVPTTDANNAAKSENHSSPTTTQPTTTATPVTTMPGSKTDTPNDATKPGSLDQGKNLFVSKCAKCHALKTPGDYTTDRWNEILKVMVPRARLNHDEEEAVTAYLLANSKK